MESSSRLAIISLIVSICGAIIALCALGLSVYMGWLQKNNYEISVQPYITLVPTIDINRLRPPLTAGGLISAITR